MTAKSPIHCHITRESHRVFGLKSLVVIDQVLGILKQCKMNLEAIKWPEQPLLDTELQTHFGRQIELSLSLDPLINDIDELIETHKDNKRIFENPKDPYHNATKDTIKTNECK